jgi:hypothetical protein
MRRLGLRWRLADEGFPEGPLLTEAARKRKRLPDNFLVTVGRCCPP